jgi:hypothetical protein
MQIGRGNQNLLQCHIVHHKLHVTWAMAWPSHLVTLTSTLLDNWKKTLNKRWDMLVGVNTNTELWFFSQLELSILCITEINVSLFCWTSVLK